MEDFLNFLANTYSVTQDYSGEKKKQQVSMIYSNIMMSIFILFELAK